MGTKRTKEHTAAHQKSYTGSEIELKVYVSLISKGFWTVWVSMVGEMHGFATLLLRCSYTLKV